MDHRVTTQEAPHKNRDKASTTLTHPTTTHSRPLKGGTPHIHLHLNPTSFRHHPKVCGRGGIGGGGGGGGGRVEPYITHPKGGEVNGTRVSGRWSARQRPDTIPASFQSLRKRRRRRWRWRRWRRKSGTLHNPPRRGGLMEQGSVIRIRLNLIPVSFR